MINFENPEYLFLIFILIPVFFLFFINIRKLKKAYCYTQDSKRIIKLIKIRAIFFSFAWIFLVLALACPLWGAKPISVRRRGISVIFVTDISKSMTINDIGISRLALQKQFLKVLLEKFDNTSCGLVITKGKGILSVPLSFEKNAIFSVIDSLSPHILTSAGTNLEAGVLTALNSFSANRGNSKIIILCTDGGETEGNLLNACNIIKKSDANLIIIGFGNIKGGQVSFYDEKGNSKTKNSKLEEKFLIDAAEKAGTNSFYISALENGAIHKILEAVNSGIKGNEKMVYIQEPVKRNFEMTFIAFIFICLGGIPFYGKNK